MSPFDANPAVTREKPAEEQMAPMAAGEKCMMQFVQLAEFLPRYHLNLKVTDQYTAVNVTRQEGNPQIRMPFTIICL